MAAVYLLPSHPFDSHRHFISLLYIKIPHLSEKVICFIQITLAIISDHFDFAQELSELLPDGNYIHNILQATRIYSDASEKVLGRRSAVGLHDKFSRCTI